MTNCAIESQTMPSRLSSETNCSCGIVGSSRRSATTAKSAKSSISFSYSESERTTAVRSPRSLVKYCTGSLISKFYRRSQYLSRMSIRSEDRGQLRCWLSVGSYLVFSPSSEQEARPADGAARRPYPLAIGVQPSRKATARRAIAATPQPLNNSTSFYSRIFLPLISCSSMAMSASVMIRTSSGNVVFGAQPNCFFAFEASPISRSTSAGR